MYRFENEIRFADKENDILLIGELLVDMISNEYDDNQSCSNYQRFFGGSPANIAMNVKSLGGKTIIASAVGQDGFGNFLINHLENNNIDTKLINRVNKSTSMVVVTKSKSTPKPIFYRLADYNIEFNDEIEQAIKSSKVLHFSCWPISQAKSRSTIEQAIDVAKKNNTIISFDPNYHELLWEEGHDAMHYIKTLISTVDIIKPSEVDAERIFGYDTAENQINKFLNLGAKLVIMTLGKDGAIVSNGKETFKFETLATEVIDTTGAGDAFWGGFYAGISKEYKLIDALNIGFATSAFKLKSVGAIANLPSIDELQGMYCLQGR